MQIYFDNFQKYLVKKYYNKEYLTEGRENGKCLGKDNIVKRMVLTEEHIEKIKNTQNKEYFLYKEF